ncbi:MAG: hypothetical protein ACTS47_00190 [Candidatus Hodgkinia cicadicola]
MIESFIWASDGVWFYINVPTLFASLLNNRLKFDQMANTLRYFACGSKSWRERPFISPSICSQLLTTNLTLTEWSFGSLNLNGQTKHFGKRKRHGKFNETIVRNCANQYNNADYARLLRLFLLKT